MVERDALGPLVDRRGGHRIEVSSKLDSRLTRSLYMGDRWVSPATFSVRPRGRP